MEGKAKYDGRFSRTLKSIQKERTRNLKLAHEGDGKSMGHLESYLRKVTEGSENGTSLVDSPRVQKVTAGSWNWSWALDEDEHPPPSSIVSRRDTWEARQLAMIADLMPESTISGNNLWQHLVTFLTVTPDRKNRLPAEREHPKPEAGEQAETDWASASIPLETSTQVDATTKASPLAQTNGTAILPKPSNVGSMDTRPRGPSYWTRGSLWKEKFRVNHFSNTHGRGPSLASMKTRVARTTPV